MNELDILLAKPIDIQVGNKKYTFNHPTLEWWAEFVLAIGGLFDKHTTGSMMAGILKGTDKGRKADKIISLFCQTISTSPKALKKDLTLHQALYLLDKWVDCIGIEAAKSFLKGLEGKLQAALQNDTPSAASSSSSLNDLAGQ